MSFSLFVGKRVGESEIGKSIKLTLGERVVKLVNDSVGLPVGGIV